MELLESALKFCHGEGPHDTPLQGLRVSWHDKTTEAIPGKYSTIVCLVLQGEKHVWSGKNVYRYNPENYLVSCVDTPAIYQVTKASPASPFIGVTLEIQPSVVYDILRDIVMPFTEDDELEGGFYVEKVSHEMKDAFARLLKAVGSKEEMTILAPSIVREIHYRLMHSRYGSRIRQLGIVGSKAQRISKIVDHMQKDYAEPLKVTELAQMANMSPSAFHMHFREITNMSPLQYQKQIRLQEARRLLSVETTDAASVAFKVGYESTSQFSREYRRLFGRPPMQDLKTLRMRVPVQSLE